MNRFDLSTSLWPWPGELPENHTPVDDLGELGSLLVRRTVSPHAAVSAGIAGDLHLSTPTNMFTPVTGVRAAHEAIVRWKGDSGIIRVIPDDQALAAYDGIATDIGLGNGFRLPMEQLLEQDRSQTLVLSTPNGISGQIAALQDIVRLARHFHLLVIDERLTAFSMRRLTPLVLEWENIVFVQRFPFIMPGQSQDFGWIIHPAELQSELTSFTTDLPDSTLEEALHYGGINTFAASRQVARNKSQLYRELRKLSIVSVPYPSWSNSLLAQVERGNRDEIVQALEQRRIAVFTPPHENLLRTFRVSAVNGRSTRAIRDALIDINLEMG